MAIARSSAAIVFVLIAVPGDGDTGWVREELIMLFMVIEHFKDRDGVAVYRRHREQGRMMPEGLKYVDSWVEPNFARCFQLMECDDPSLFQQWIARWQDLVDFEIIPVVTSKEAAQEIASRL